MTLDRQLNYGSDYIEAIRNYGLDGLQHEGYEHAFFMGELGDRMFANIAFPSKRQAKGCLSLLPHSVYEALFPYEKWNANLHRDAWEMTREQVPGWKNMVDYR